jgi:hypothetical protein
LALAIPTSLIVGRDSGNTTPGSVELSIIGGNDMARESGIPLDTAVSH